MVYLFGVVRISSLFVTVYLQHLATIRSSGFPEITMVNSPPGLSGELNMPQNVFVGSWRLNYLCNVLSTKEAGEALQDTFASSENLLYNSKSKSDFDQLPASAQQVVSHISSHCPQ